MKIFHYKKKIDSLTRDIPRITAPIHVRIKPTNVCNHNCWYCAYRAENLQLGQDMAPGDQIPRGKMITIVDDLAEMGVKAVTFSGGGDPFCYPHLLYTAKRLSQASIKFASLTNGSRLEGELSDFFAHHATWLRVSIDGWDDQSYARYRGIETGEYTRLIRNLENFNKIGGTCLLGVSLVVDQQNPPHIYSSLQRLKNAGIKSVKVSPCIISNDAAETNTYHRPHFKRAKGQIQQAVTELADENFEIYDAFHEVDLNFRKSYHWCPSLQILPVIGADLNIYPCQDKAYNVAEGLLGSIRTTSFKTFWFNDKAKFFKFDPSKVCNHHCVAHAKNRLLLEYLEADQEHLAFV